MIPGPSPGDRRSPPGPFAAPSARREGSSRGDATAAAPRDGTRRRDPAPGGEDATSHPSEQGVRHAGRPGERRDGGVGPARERAGP